MIIHSNWLSNFFFFGNPNFFVEIRSICVCYFKIVNLDTFLDKTWIIRWNTFFTINKQRFFSKNPRFSTLWTLSLPYMACACVGSNNLHTFKESMYYKWKSKVLHNYYYNTISSNYRWADEFASRDVTSGGCTSPWTQKRGKRENKWEGPGKGKRRRKRERGSIFCLKYVKEKTGALIRKLPPDGQVWLRPCLQVQTVQSFCLNKLSGTVWIN